MIHVMKLTNEIVVHTTTRYKANVEKGTNDQNIT